MATQIALTYAQYFASSKKQKIEVKELAYTNGAIVQHRSGRQETTILRSRT